MKKFSLKVLTPILAILLLSQFAISSTAVSVLTDNENDVTKVTWKASGLDYTSETASKPSIDIVSVDYAETAEGNHTITLELAGTPVLDDETFYWITVEEDAVDFTLFIWAGGFTGYSAEAPGMLTYAKGSDNAFAIMGPQISGNTLVWNVPQIISYYGLTDVSLDYLTATPGAEWEWHIWAWNGLAFSSQSGEWYMDYYPDEDNTYEDDGGGGSAPGFEIAVLFFSLPLVAVLKKRK